MLVVVLTPPVVVVWCYAGGSCSHPPPVVVVWCYGGGSCSPPPVVVVWCYGGGGGCTCRRRSRSSSSS